MKWKLTFPTFFLPLDNLAARVRQADVPVRKGVVPFLGEWPSQAPGAIEPNSVGISAAFRMKWDGFCLGYELIADASFDLYGQTRLTESGLRNLNVRYTDDRLEADARRSVPVEDLIELLRRPENRVPHDYSCIIPGGEMLSFSPPLNALMFRGAEARRPLVAHLADGEIRNEVVLALGAVGDESTIPVLISHYPRGPLEDYRAPSALTRVCFSYALCWLTGQAIDRGREGTFRDETNAAKWEAWWAAHGGTFRVPSVKPYATWVPNYPLLADSHVGRIRAMFADGGGGSLMEYE